MKTAKEFRAEIPSTLDEILKEVQSRNNGGCDFLNLYKYVNLAVGFYYPTFNYRNSDLEKLKELGFEIKEFKPYENNTTGFLWWKKPVKNKDEIFHTIYW